MSAERRSSCGFVLLGQLQWRGSGQGLPLVPARLPRRPPVLQRYLSADWAGAARQLARHSQWQLRSSAPAGCGGSPTV